MTVIQPNSVAGINSITVQSGNSLAIHKSNGELLRTITGTTGVSTFSSISVGTAYTDNSAAKSINIGVGASISQHDANTLSLGTGGDERARIDSSGRLLLGTTTEGHGNADDLTIATSANTGITIRSGTSNGGNIFFSDATSGTGEYAGMISYDHNDNIMTFATTDGTERLRITSTGDINVSTAATIKANGNATFSGIVTATSFSGSGANLTGISAGTSLSGSTNNQVTTVTGANAIQGESNLTFDGTDLDIIKSNSSIRLTCSNETPTLNFNANSLSDAGRIKVAESGGGGVMLFYSNTSGTLTESFRINTDQTVSIGGGYAANSAKLNLNQDGTHITCRSPSTGGYYSIYFRSANTNVGNIFFNSGGVQFNTSSDYRRKENVVGITSAITRLKTLIPKRFNFITESGVTRDGFLAHEVTTVPEAITGTKDAVSTTADVTAGISTYVGEPIYQTIDQSKLVPLLTAALQEAVTKIETLETKVAALEGG